MGGRSSGRGSAGQARRASPCSPAKPRPIPITPTTHSPSRGSAMPSRRSTARRSRRACSVARTSPFSPAASRTGDSTPRRAAPARTPPSVRFLAGGGAALASCGGAYYLSRGRPAWLGVADARPVFTQEYLRTGVGVVTCGLEPGPLRLGLPPTLEIPYFHGPVYDELGPGCAPLASFRERYGDGRLFIDNPLSEETLHAAHARPRRGPARLRSARRGGAVLGPSRDGRSPAEIHGARELRPALPARPRRARHARDPRQLRAGRIAQLPDDPQCRRGPLAKRSRRLARRGARARRRRSGRRPLGRDPAARRGLADPARGVPAQPRRHRRPRAPAFSPASSGASTRRSAGSTIG